MRENKSAVLNEPFLNKFKKKQKTDPRWVTRTYVRVTDVRSVTLIILCIELHVFSEAQGILAVSATCQSH